MINFNFTHNDKDYSKRTKSSLAINIVVSMTIGLVVTLSSDIGWGLGIALFAFIVQYFKSDRWDKTFIFKICFDNENVLIEYFNRETKNTLSGHLNEFTFKKQIAFNRTRTAYLAVYQNNELKIKQFEISDWTESKMDQVINSFAKNNPSLADT
jgi:hypothetical protein